jgi:hypothetical protein
MKIHQTSPSATETIGIQSSQRYAYEVLLKASFLRSIDFSSDENHTLHVTFFVFATMLVIFSSFFLPSFSSLASHDYYIYGPTP